MKPELLEALAAQLRKHGYDCSVEFPGCVCVVSCRDGMPTDMDWWIGNANGTIGGSLLADMGAVCVASFELSSTPKDVDEGLVAIPLLALVIHGWMANTSRLLELEALAGCL